MLTKLNKQVRMLITRALMSSSQATSKWDTVILWSGSGSLNRILVRTHLITYWLATPTQYASVTRLSPAFHVRVWLHEINNPCLNSLLALQLRIETLVCYDTLIWSILSGELFNRCRKWEFNRRSQQHIVGVKVLYTGEISWMERK